MMVPSRFRQVILSFVIAAALLPGPALAAGRVAAPQVAPQIGLVGQEGGESYAVALGGTNAYLGVGPRVVVVNIANPAVPVRSGQSAPLPEIVQGLTASANAVYVADGESGLKIIDVTNPASPQLRGSLDTPGWAQNVALSGSTAYIADRTGGLRIVDVSNPLAPVELAAMTAAALGGGVEGIAVSGNTAYVGAGAGGLVLVNVTIPAAPAILGRYQATDFIAQDVDVLDSTAYVADGGKNVVAVKITDPASPQLVNSLALDGDGVPDGLRVAGSSLFLAMGEKGVDVFDINLTTGELRFQVTLETPAVAHDVASNGVNAIVADGRAGLQIVNIASPAEVGAYRTLGAAHGIVTSGSYAYVAAAEGGLSVMNVSNPANPAQAGRVDTPGYAEAVAVEGAHAYIADGDSGLAVLDVANPANPTLSGQLALPGGYAQAVVVTGTYAYVAADVEGLKIVNVTNPAAPSLVGTFKPAGNAPISDVAIEGNFAYVAAGTSGVRVVNISDPAAPSEVAVIPSGDFAWAVDLADGYLFIADIDGGLRIADVTTPASPTVVTSYTGLGVAVEGVTVSGRHALVWTTNSLNILDISAPANPILRASHQTAGTPRDVAVGNVVLLTDFDGGLRVLNPTDVAVSVATAGAWANLGQPQSLTVTVTNHGPSAAAGVQLVDTLPAGVAFVSASAGCGHAGGVVTCAIGSMAGGASVDVNITVTPASLGSFATTATVSSSATEIHAPNNSAVKAVLVLQRALFLPVVTR